MAKARKRNKDDWNEYYSDEQLARLVARRMKTLRPDGREKEEPMGRWQPDPPPRMRVVIAKRMNGKMIL